MFTTGGLALSDYWFSVPASPTSQEAWRPSRDNESTVERITEAALRGYIRFLADDLLEGRGRGRVATN